MAGIDRKAALCDQTELTGIDFVQVADPAAQDVLLVFFIVPPDAMTPPLVSAAALLPPGTRVHAAGLAVEVVSTETRRSLPIDALNWLLAATPSGPRPALEVVFPGPGAFEIHRLTVTHPQVDPFFGSVDFSFKQACPSDFDCRLPCEPEPPERVDVPIDYLARDFWSLRRALLDFAAARYPHWSEALEADQAVMLMEIMAALGDEFAYTQDRIARELALPTASQRRSRSSLARLVDYAPDPGQAATTEIVVWVEADGGFAEIGDRVWATPEGRPPVTFAVEDRVWHHANWNAVPLHIADTATRCLPRGATEAYLVTNAPTVAELPPGTVGPPAAFWAGRRMMLHAQPSAAGEPERAVAVTIASVAAATDSLTVPPTDLARIRWEEPLPWPMPLADTAAHLNLATVRAGEAVRECFRIGSDDALDARYPLLLPADRRDALALPRAVERQGPHLVERGARGRILRYGLRAAESAGLGWTGPRDPLGIGTESGQEPMLILTEVEPPGYAPAPFGATWQFRRDILESGLDAPVFTLEEGTWREVVTHQTPLETVVFQDYASDAGWSLRFGEGAFGRPPEEGTVFEVRYRTGPGSAANLGPMSITQIDPPPGAPPGPTLTHASAVANLLPVADGRDEATAEAVRIDAPEAFRALPLRAVRPEDYGRILERRDDVERAHSTTRWTGSWSTDFVAADPQGRFAPEPEQLRAFAQAVDCVRQAGRDARVRAPDYVDLDLAVEVCVQPTAYPGEVVRRVRKALAAPGFFDPGNFTFGQSLRRSALEAAVQEVPGVKAVEAIRLRLRHRQDWQPFSEAELPVEPWQIVRLQNDPDFPNRGSLRISAHGGAS